MKILVACQNMNAYGGSELYHYELLMGLSEYKDLDISFITMTIPNKDFHLYKDLIDKGIKVLGLAQLSNIQFDLIICSQPQPTQTLCHLYPGTPKISIIHSALRSEDAIQHESIKHYIAVQPDIYRCLKNQYGIKTKDISLLYNPFDITRFKKYPQHRRNVNGVLVGEIDDSLRRPMIEHIVQECIRDNMELTIISKSKHDFQHKLIEVVDQCYNTEKYLKYADFTVGIGGRQMIEGWLCGIPGYVYKVDPQGRILDIQLKQPPKIRRFDRDNVCKQHYNLYHKILQ